jgi:bacterioferritin (cytochrome b1)
MAVRKEHFDHEQQGMSPLSDVHFDLITALQNKCEALAIYETYIEDCDDAGDDDCRRVFEQIMRDDLRHAELLKSHLEHVVRDGKFS